MNQEIEELTKQLVMLEKIAKQYMTKEAVSRYGNLKIAHPETAVKAISIIAQASQTGQINEPISDDEFKSLLIEIQQGKKTFKFRR
ncbi:MAG: DNA-binding protein [Candidatus Pacearchaeota archaeon]